jgi:hypothetical protein
MPERSRPSFLLAPLGHTELPPSGGRWRMSIARVGCGVVTGRLLRGRGNAHTAVWSLLRHRRQVEAFAAHDPLRFDDPLLFSQARKALEHVFDRADPASL